MTKITRGGWMDSDLLFKMWTANWPPTVIGEWFGVTDSAVRNSCRRNGLSNRQSGDVMKAGFQLRNSKLTLAQHVDLLQRGQWGQVVDDDPQPPAATPTFNPPGWDVRHDGQVYETKGRYEAMARLSNRLGIPQSRILARYHQLRAG